MPKTTKTSTPRPTVRPIEGVDRYRVTFPGIDQAVIICKLASGEWSYRREGDDVGAITWDERAACARAWALVMDVPKALTYSDEEVDEMAKAARQDSRTATKILKTLLRERTGFAWSVTCSRSRTSSFMRIKPLKARAVTQFDYLCPHDQALLGRILYPSRHDVVHNQGYLFDYDERDWLVRAIAGKTIEAAA